MWQYHYSPDIYHFGVKGMKWGVRKDIRMAESSVLVLASTGSAVMGLRRYMY